MRLVRTAYSRRLLSFLTPALKEPENSHPIIKYAILWTMAVAFGVATVESAVAQEPISLDNLINAENFETILFSPRGDLIALERQLPVSERSPTSFHLSWINDKEVLVVDEAGNTRSIHDAKDVRLSLMTGDAWTPRGDGILLRAASPRSIGLAFWDAKTNQVSMLPGKLPEAFWSPYAWVADDRLIYVALPDHAVQSTSFAQVLGDATSRWQLAWAGNGRPQVTINSNDPSLPAPSSLSGKLMIADPRIGTATELADGTYSALVPSSDKRRIAALRRSQDSNTQRLSIISLTSGLSASVVEIANVEVSSATVAWSPDGTSLLVGGELRGSDDIGLVRIDAATGAASSVVLNGLGVLDRSALQRGKGILPIGWIGGQPAAIASRPSVKDNSSAPSTQRGFDYGESEGFRFDLFVFGGANAENLTGFSKESVSSFLPLPEEAGAFVIAEGALWKVRAGSAVQRVSPASGPKVIAFAVDRRYPQPPLTSAYTRSGRGGRVALLVAGKNRVPKRAILDVESGRYAKIDVENIVASSNDLERTIASVRRGWVTELTLRRGVTKKTLRVINPELADKAISQPMHFSYSVGGEERHGWYLLPPNASKSSRPLPAVLVAYGGQVFDDVNPPSEVSGVISDPVFSGQLLAAQGYAVIYPSLPVDAGATSNMMSTLAENAVAATDALIAKGVVDKERVGIMGQSFGGYTTAAILTQRSDRFKAGIALAGAYDWISAYGARDLSDQLSAANGDNWSAYMDVVEGGQIGLGQPFWKNPDAYIRNSPIFHVESLDAPLLILHGDLDFGLTSLSGAERMYAALVRAGKEPALIRYWGEGHVVQSEAAVRHQWSSIVTWLGTKLAPAKSEK